MSFIFGHLISMRYLLLGYIRHWTCLAGQIAHRDTAQLILLGLTDRRETSAEGSVL